ncbi:MAG TPA: DUF6766 family protein [Candidatus Saccharimonadales bacterium]|nr:DUF6766 family protein [Candidatus Saccharimonadales bacterium]
MKQFVKDNSLSLVMFGLFFVFLAALSVTGYMHANEQLAAHRQSPESFGQYIISGEFIEAVFENWESEFLQMGAFVLLTIWLFQKGSVDSKKLRGKQAIDAPPRYSFLHARTWRQRCKALSETLYGNSLTIALFSLFLLSFVLHAWGGAAAHNEEALLHGEAQLSVWQYAASSQFWFESFQNWQSEFLSVGALIVLSIFLRQRHSPESKPVAAPNSQTGD